MKEQKGSIRQKESSIADLQKNTSPLRATAFGFVLWIFYAFLTSGVNFEQWRWKIHLWIRYYYDQWWTLYTTIEAIVYFLLLAVYLFIFLPFLINSATRAQKPMQFLWTAIGTLYLTTIFSYGVSERILSGVGQITPVLRDVGGSLISFAISVTFIILLPLTAVVFTKLLWQKHGEIRRKQRESS